MISDVEPLEPEENNFLLSEVTLFVIQQIQEISTSPEALLMLYYLTWVISTRGLLSYCCFLKLIFTYLEKEREGERERENEWGRGRERGRERESPKQALANCEIMT